MGLWLMLGILQSFELLSKSIVCAGSEEYQKTKNQKNEKQARLSCAKLRASLYLSGLD